MYPGDGADQDRHGEDHQHGDGSSGAPAPGPGEDPKQWYVVPPEHPQGPYAQPPGYQEPGYQQQPVYERPAYQHPAYGQPAYQHPAYEQPVYQQSAYPHPAYQHPAYQHPGYEQPGYQQPVHPQGVGYPQQPPYPVDPNLVPPQNSGQGFLVGIVATVAIAAMLTVLGVAVYAITRDDPTDNPAATGSLPASASPSTPPTASAAPERSADPTDGLAAGSGPVRVDVYVDYQCPPCSTFEASTGGVLTGYISSKRITLRIHPVAFVDDRSKNNYATRAAAAMACAYEADKLLEFHSYLLRNQPAEDTFGPTDEQLVRAGDSMGMGSGFKDCVSGRRKVDWVGQATTAAQNHGVASVPAAYVNSREVETIRSDLVAAITAAP
jgi:protein-disulfide isomerase